MSELGSALGLLGDTKRRPSSEDSDSLSTCSEEDSDVSDTVASRREAVSKHHTSDAVIDTSKQNVQDAEPWGHATSTALQIGEKSSCLSPDRWEVRFSL